MNTRPWAKCCRIEYNEKADRFDVLISSDGGKNWALSRGYECFNRASDKPGIEPAYIHCSALQYLKNLSELGYMLIV